MIGGMSTLGSIVSISGREPWKVSSRNYRQCERGAQAARDKDTVVEEPRNEICHGVDFFA